MSFFGKCIDELSLWIDFPIEKEDKGCTLVLDHTLEVRIEPFQGHEEGILVAIPLVALPEGVFRDQVFESALYCNSRSWVKEGKFGFSRANGSLILFEVVPAAECSGEYLADLLESMSKHARDWIQNLRAGHTAPPFVLDLKDAKKQNPDEKCR